MKGPTADLNYVDIPGYADALKREDSTRRQAWVNDRDSIAGVPVRPLTWRDVETLTEMKNGFFCPWKFDTDAEYIGHCAQLVWWLSECQKPARGDSFFSKMMINAQRVRLIRHLSQDPKQMSTDVLRILSDTFMDAPKGAGSQTASSSIAGGPAYIADTLAAGGYNLTFKEILDMPLVQLFQTLRLVSRRLYGQSVTNPSDKLATDYLATLNQGKN
jgi:hypothetical protein